MSPILDLLCQKASCDLVLIEYALLPNECAHALSECELCSILYFLCDKNCCILRLQGHVTCKTSMIVNCLVLSIYRMMQYILHLVCVCAIFSVKVALVPSVVSCNSCCCNKLEGAILSVPRSLGLKTATTSAGCMLLQCWCHSTLILSLSP